MSHSGINENLHECNRRNNTRREGRESREKSTGSSHESFRIDHTNNQQSASHPPTGTKEHRFDSNWSTHRPNKQVCGVVSLAASNPKQCHADREPPSTRQRGSSMMCACVQSAQRFQQVNSCASATFVVVQAVRISFDGRRLAVECERVQSLSTVPNHPQQ